MIKPNSTLTWPQVSNMVEVMIDHMEYQQFPSVDDSERNICSYLTPGTNGNPDTMCIVGCLLSKRQQLKTLELNVPVDDLLHDMDIRVESWVVSKFLTDAQSLHDALTLRSTYMEDGGYRRLPTMWNEEHTEELLALREKYDDIYERMQDRGQI